MSDYILAGAQHMGVANHRLQEMLWLMGVANCILQGMLRLMGVANWLHWTAWFVKHFIFHFLIVLGMTSLLVIDFVKGAVLRHVDATLLFTFLLLYAVTVILMCFAISVLFSKGAHALSC